MKGGVQRTEKVQDNEGGVYGKIGWAWIEVVCFLSCFLVMAGWRDTGRCMTLSVVRFEVLDS